MRIIALLVTTAATAGAATPKPFADGMTITFHDHALFVRAKDGREVKLEAADGLTAVHYDGASKLVTIDYDTRFCTYASQLSYPLALLHARLENTRRTRCT